MRDALFCSVNLLISVTSVFAPSLSIDLHVKQSRGIGLQTIHKNIPSARGFQSIFP